MNCIVAIENVKDLLGSWFLKIVVVERYTLVGEDDREDRDKEKKTEENGGDICTCESRSDVKSFHARYQGPSIAIPG